MSCCCECLSCLRCCDSCQGRRRGNKYADGPPPFAPYQGYQPAPTAPPIYQPSGFATFETPSKGRIHEDSLPAMPSWDTATSRKVEDQSETNDMEMGHLASQPRYTTGIATNGARTGRDGYSQIADQPSSPFGNGPAAYQGADTTHAYVSDLGTQRLAAQDIGYGGYNSGAAASSSYAQNQYSDRPLYGARPPSYRTSPPSEYGQGSYGQGSLPPMNRLSMPNAAAYNNSYIAPQSPPAQWSPTESTRYAPTTIAESQHISPTGYRPPSLLQAGRKPVPGSGREV